MLLALVVAASIVSWAAKYDVMLAFCTSGAIGVALTAVICRPLKNPLLLMSGGAAGGLAGALAYTPAVYLQFSQTSLSSALLWIFFVVTLVAGMAVGLGIGAIACAATALFQITTGRESRWQKQSRATRPTSSPFSSDEYRES